MISSSVRPPTSTSAFGRESVSGRRRVHTVVVDSFRLGDIEARAARLPVLGARVLEGLDGILSMDHLRGMHLTADFASAEVRMMNGASDETPSNALAMRLWERYRQLIVVEARIGKHRVPAIIDTGGAHTLGNIPLLNSLIADAGGALDGVIRSQVTDATDTVLDTWDSRIGRLDIGPVAIDDLRVSFARFPVFQFWQLEREPALLIGMVRAFGTIGFPSFTDGLIYILMIVILLLRPQGLFGRKA